MIYSGLLLFFLLEYGRPEAFIPGLMALHLNSLVPLTVAAAGLVWKGRISNGELLDDRNTQLLLFLLFLIGISVPMAAVTTYAFDTFTAVLGYVLIYLVIAKHVKTRTQIKGIFVILLLIHLGVAALNPQIFTAGDREYIQGAPFLGDGNDFALSLNITLPMCLFLFFGAARTRGRLLYGAALIVIVFGIIVTQSRGGTLALGCVGLYYWLGNDRKLLTGIVAAVVAALVLANAPAGYFQRMQEMTNTEEGSAQGRIDAWKTAVAIAVDHPLMGAGAGHFPVENGVRNHMSAKTAHSIYFLILGELGIPGLAMLLWFIGSNLRANRRLASEIRRSEMPRSIDARLLMSLSASLIAYATGGAFLSATYTPHMFVLAGLLTAARSILRLEHLQTADQSAAIRAPQAISMHWALRVRRPAAFGPHHGSVKRGSH